MVTQPELYLKFNLCDDKLELFGYWITCGNSVFSCSNYECCWWTKSYEQLPDAQICWLCSIVAVIYQFTNWKCAKIFSILVSLVCFLEAGVIDWDLLHRITGRSGNYNLWLGATMGRNLCGWLSISTCIGMQEWFCYEGILRNWLCWTYQRK